MNFEQHDAVRVINYNSPWSQFIGVVADVNERGDCYVAFGAFDSKWFTPGELERVKYATDQPTLDLLQTAQDAIMAAENSEFPVCADCSWYNMETRECWHSPQKTKREPVGYCSQHSATAKDRRVIVGNPDEIATYIVQKVVNAIEAREEEQLEYRIERTELQKDEMVRQAEKTLKAAKKPSLLERLGLKR